MRAKVVSIESGASYADGGRRLVIKFVGVTGLYDVVRLPEREISIVGLGLDSELEVNFTPARTGMGIIEIDAPLAQAIRHDEKVKRDEAATAAAATADDPSHI